MSGTLGGLLTKKATFLFGIEAVAGTNPGLDPDVHAVEVNDPDFTTDVTVLERDFVSNDLSPFEDQIGKIIAGFKVIAEVRGNGRQQSGNLNDAPILARMIQACGFELYAMTATGTDCHSPVVAVSENPKTAPRVRFASTVDATSNTAPVLYTIEVTTPGGTGVAKVTVHSNSDEDVEGGDIIAAPVESAAITSGVTKITLGAKGGSVIATWTGALVANMRWQVAVFPRGIKAMPISKNFKTASMELNLDGLYHEGNRGIGTFQIDSTAGDISKATFNFTTAFNEPTDDEMPEVDFGDLPLPPQVEFATFTWGGNMDLVVEKFTYDHGGQIEARPSVNHKNGYAGSRIVDRKPKVGFNPEATLNADHPHWDEYINAKSKTLLARVGTEVGNQTVFFHGKTQVSEMPYGDRSGVRTYEKTAWPKRIDGNDETIIVFC